MPGLGSDHRIVKIATAPPAAPAIRAAARRQSPTLCWCLCVGHGTSGHLAPVPDSPYFGGMTKGSGPVSEGAEGSAFEVDPKILAEGEWLKAMLAGPPEESPGPVFLRRATGYLALLAGAVAERFLTTRNKAPQEEIDAVESAEADILSELHAIAARLHALARRLT